MRTGAEARSLPTGFFLLTSVHATGETLTQATGGRRPSWERPRRDAAAAVRAGGAGPRAAGARARGRGALGAGDGAAARLPGARADAALRHGGQAPGPVGATCPVGAEGRVETPCCAAPRAGARTAGDSGHRSPPRPRQLREPEGAKTSCWQRWQRRRSAAGRRLGEAAQRLARGFGLWEGALYEIGGKTCPPPPPPRSGVAVSSLETGGGHPAGHGSPPPPPANPPSSTPEMGRTSVTAAPPGGCQRYC